MAAPIRMNIFLKSFHFSKLLNNYSDCLRCCHPAARSSSLGQRTKQTIVHQGKMFVPNRLSPLYAGHYESSQASSQQQNVCGVLVSQPKRGMVMMKRKSAKKFSGLHKNDGVDAENILVYVNSSHRYIYWCNLLLHPLAFSSSAISVFDLYLNVFSRPNVLDALLTDNGLTCTLVPIMATFLLASTRGLAHRMIRRLYYNEQTRVFTAVTLDWLTFFSKKLQFTKNDTVLRQGSRALLTFRGNVLIKGKKFFLADSDFRSPEYFNTLMGWDRQPYVIDKDFDNVFKNIQELDIQARKQQNQKT